MTKNQKIIYKLTQSFTIPLLLSFSLSACNSSSSSNDATNGSDLLTGQITGVSIEGLSYQTESQSGTTIDSTFTYKAGESISFFVGDIAIGQTNAVAELTLFDLVGITDPDSLADGAETKLKQATRSSFQFEHLSNLIVLLSAIDEDGDFANGVVIPAGLDSIAQGKTLDILGSKTKTFKNDLNGSELLSEAVTGGIWQSTPTIVSPGAALDAFYAAMGITPEVYTTAKELYDTDEDGNADLTTSYAFDDAGNLVSKTRETDDLSTSEVTTYTYDNSARNIGIYRESNENGRTYFSQQEKAFDAEGREILSQTDSDGNGIFEVRRVTETEYYESGYPSYNKQSDEQFSETTGELLFLSAYTTKYDTQGNPTYQSSTYQNNYDGQTSSQSITYTYNSAGKKTKEEIDNDGDGTADVIHSYGYNDEQQQILEESDLNGDGEIDTRETVIIDSSTNTMTVNTDSNADGITDNISTAVYDDNNNIISQRIDEGNDGTFEEVTTWDYIYNSEGFALSTNEVSETSPEENQLTTFTFDDEGRPLTYSHIFANAPEQNYLQTIAYDDAGEATFYSTEYGVINTDYYSRTTTVIHDTYGGQTTTEYDSNNEIKSVDSLLYDDRGNQIEESSSDTYEGGISTNKITWTYNSYDQVIAESVIRSSEAYSNTTYTYDEQGELVTTASTVFAYWSGNEEDQNTVTTFEYVDLASWGALYRR